MDILAYIKNRLVIKNSLLNFGSQGIVILLAFYCLPILVNTLSPEKFGLLTIVWVIIGYFSIFDLGISRAVTKYLSEVKLENKTQKINQLIWSAILSGIVIGLIGMLILFFGSEMIIPYFKSEIISLGNVVDIVKIASLGIPFIVVFGIIKGVQSAYHRFDLVNIYQFVLGNIQWLGSIVVIKYGFDVYEIVLLTVFARAIVTIFSFFQLSTLIKEFSLLKIETDKHLTKKLFKFGGWLTISQLLSPIFLYVDRLFIGIFISFSAVGYYSLAQESLSRLLMIPLSISMAIFPITSEYFSLIDSGKHLSTLFTKSLFYLTLVLLPLFVFLALFSPEILSVWVGNEVAIGTAKALTILSVGYFFNSLAQIPTTFLHAQNKPNITAVLHIIELPLATALSALTIYYYGIAGAAFAWSFRAFIDCALLVIISKKNISPTYSFQRLKRLFPILAPLMGVLLASMIINYFQNGMIKILLFIPSTALLMYVYFRSGIHVLDGMHKKT